MHRRALEVFRGRCEDGVALVLDEAGHGVINWDHAVIGELLQRLEAATAGINRKTCLRQRMNHQVLLDAGFANACEKLGFDAGARRHLANVERAGLQLVERDQTNVGRSVRRCRCGGFCLLHGGGFRAG